MIKNIYVSGATGLVGSAVVQELTNCGYRVYSLKFNLLYSNELKQLRDYLDCNEIDLVIHCAGKVGGIKANSEDGEGFREANLDMGRNLIDTAKGAKVPYFINLASSCAYPVNSTLPLTEDQFFYDKAEYESTNEGYALAKMDVAAYLMGQYKAKGITLIPCNLYGVGDRYFEGSHIIPDLIQKFHAAKKYGLRAITLYGTGQQYREFMNAKDLAKIILQLIQRPMLEGKFFPEYLLNIRTGKEISTMELATKIAGVVGWEGTIKWGGQLSGVKRKPMDISRLHKLGLSLDKFLDKETPLVSGLVEQNADYIRRFIDV